MVLPLRWDNRVYIPNIYHVLRAFPNLEFLQLRSYVDNDNFLKSNLEILEVRNPVDGSFIKTKPLELKSLKTLIIHLDNLSPDNFAKICNLNLPALEYFELDVGFDIYFEDIIPIASGKSFPNLIYLELNEDPEKAIKYF